jgi:hypothetical protein
MKSSRDRRRSGSRVGDRFAPAMISLTLDEVDAMECGPPTSTGSASVALPGRRSADALHQTHASAIVSRREARPTRGQRSVAEAVAGYPPGRRRKLSSERRARRAKQSGGRSARRPSHVEAGPLLGGTAPRRPSDATCQAGTSLRNSL